MKNNLLFLVIILLNCDCFAQKKNIEEKQEEAFQLIFSDKNRAILLIDSLIKSSEKKSEFIQGKNLSNKGVYYAVQNQLDSAILYFNQAIKLIPKEDKFHPKLLNNLSIIYKKKGDYKEAIRILFKALKIAIKQKNFDGESRVYSELSSVYRSLNQYDLSVEYSIKSLNIIEKQNTVNKYYLNSEKQKLANLYRALGKNDFAIELYEEVIPYFDTAIYKDAKISTYINYAATLINTDDFDKAIIYLNKANQELENFENDELVSFYQLIYANYYIKKGKIEEAYNCFETAISKFEKFKDNYPKTLIEYMRFLKNQKNYDKIINLASVNNNFESLEVGLQDLVDYHRILGYAYEKKGYNNKSLYHYKLKIKYSDRLNDQNNFAIAKNLQSKYQNELLIKKNELLEKTNIIQSKTNLIIIICSSSLVIILILLLARYKSKINSSKKMLQLSEEKLEAEKKLINFKDNLLEEQKKELISRYLDARQLEEDFRKLKAKTEGLGEVNKNIKSIENVVSPKQQLQKIKYEFARLYPNFEPGLKKQYPELSKNEVLFLTLIKLDFSFKEIASILNISHQSVISKKYRIRKKMGLNQQEDIYEIIKNQV